MEKEKIVFSNNVRKKKFNGKGKDRYDFFTRYIFGQYVEEYSIHFKKKCHRMKHFVYMNIFNRFSIETII